MGAVEKSIEDLVKSRVAEAIHRADITGQVRNAVHCARDQFDYLGGRYESGGMRPEEARRAARHFEDFLLHPSRYAGNEFRFAIPKDNFSSTGPWHYGYDEVRATIVHR